MNLMQTKREKKNREFAFARPFETFVGEIGKFLHFVLLGKPTSNHGFE